MISWDNDYSEGAHERILEAFMRTNREQTAVYGEDAYSDNAKRLLRERMENRDAAIYFLVGGTQTNLVAISHSLRPYQAIIATNLGHISVHETGAIEASGHKVIEMPHEDGKLTPACIEAAVRAHSDHHMVQPQMVYLSNATEIGTVYRLNELEAIRKVCDAHGLYLYIDGARLAAALVSEAGDARLADYARLADAFCVGGTKNGALFGEVLAVVNEELKRDLPFTIKQRGALLAKGRLLGLQFEALFEDNLYEELARAAHSCAMRLKAGIAAKGYEFMTDSPTNLQFPLFDRRVKAQLLEKYAFQTWQSLDDGRDIVRLVTSWASRAEDVEEFLADLPDRT